MKRVSLLIFSLLAFSWTTWASSVLPLSFDRLSRDAHHVISGTVISIDPVQGDNGYIYSDVTIAVRRAVPAQFTDRSYQFRMIGGEIDGRRVSVQGMPRFRAGQEVVLFLNTRPSSVMGPTVGLWQGVFFVQRDKQSDKRFLVDSRGRALTRIDGNRLLHGPVETPSGVALTTVGNSAGRLDVERFFDAVRGFRAGR